MDELLIPLSAQLFSLLIGVYSYRKKSVSWSGLLALIGISSLFIWTHQIGLLFSLFYMFASSSLLTNFKKHQKQEFDQVIGKTGPRDYLQALCNLGVATVGLLGYLFIPHDAWIAAILGSIAAANADSWASEIGGLSKRLPVMITTFKSVPKGVSGGVTWLGTFGGMGGSLFITIAGIATLQWITPFQGEVWTLGIVVFLSGCAGFLVDSYLGAISQALYKNNVTEELSEQNSSQNIMVKGLPWMNNDVVNLITTLVGALTAGVSYWMR